MDDVHVKTDAAAVRLRAGVGSRARRWMTGSLAVVMASVAGVGHAASDRRTGVVRLSPYDIRETVQRLERTARGHGLPVLARVDRRGSSQAGCSLVFGSAEGGTPVRQVSAAEAPDVALAVHVEATPDGRALVHLPVGVGPGEGGGAVDWPDTVVDELAGLPSLVDEALAG
jgi:hypothetical protein